MKNKNKIKVAILSLVVVSGLVGIFTLAYQKLTAEQNRGLQTVRIQGSADTINKAADKVGDKIKSKEIGDEFFTSYTTKFTRKKEHINELLKAGGSDYRIANIEVEVGAPPTANFIIEKSAEK